MESRNFVTEFKNTIYGISRKSDCGSGTERRYIAERQQNGRYKNMSSKHTTSIRVACALMSLVTTKSNSFNIQVGEELNVSFDIDAREWQGRWFNSIRAWKVERVGATPQMPPVEAPFPPVNAAPADFSMTDEKDDLPF